MIAQIYFLKAAMQAEHVLARQLLSKARHRQNVVPPVDDQHWYLSTHNGGCLPASHLVFPNGMQLTL